MIKSLRKRPRPDQFINQQRRATNRTGRLVYLGMLAMLAVAIANYVFGDFILLRADGLAVRDKVTIATTYIAGIQSIHAEEGDSIAKGAPLMVLKSAQILERLADLSAHRARLAAEAADFNFRAETVAKLLPLAERREHATGEIYVLAYLPRNYLFSIEPGMEVAVTGGRSSAQGVISEILPVADALPLEFQNTFQQRDRSQLARIRFTSEPPFPLNEKLHIGLNQPWW